MSAIGQKTRLRFLLSTPLMYGASESGVEFDAKLPRYIRITDIRPDGTLDPDKAVSLPRNTALTYLLTDRDILLARSGTVGKAFLYRSDGDEACFAGYLIRARCDQRRMLAEYLAYYLQSAGYWDFINSSALQATIQNVSAELYKEILVTHPSVEQQKKVVAYLDEQTRKIDQLMNMRRRQMALLKEQRAAVIQEAVTRGLNPNTPMKDSGLPWLGEIPAHWALKKLKSLCSTTKGFAFKSELFVDEGVPVIRASEIKEFSVVDCSTFIQSEIALNYPQVTLRSGDILISTVGSKAEILDSAVGQVGVVPPELDGALLNQNTARLELTCPKEALQNFIFNILRTDSFRKHLDVHAHGTANQASLSLVDILSFPAQLPPLDEQISIVEFIHCQCQRIDRNIEGYTRQLTLLTEYRASLIHECVTGQRSVPETVTA